MAYQFRFPCNKPLPPKTMELRQNPRDKCPEEAVRVLNELINEQFHERPILIDVDIAIKEIARAIGCSEDVVSKRRWLLTAATQFCEYGWFVDTTSAFVIRFSVNPDHPVNKTDA